ncbi:MAG: hypothetical protein M1823_000891 [Watsoniomyces obsoletus]|nr:MAG: hypothetical protein M1823_000891 [Watsoniomyces obsoletus]
MNGPKQSALTDFLASHNISANLIRHNFLARQQAAQAANAAQNGEPSVGENGDDQNGVENAEQTSEVSAEQNAEPHDETATEEPSNGQDVVEPRTRSRKRKHDEAAAAAAAAKIKEAKSKPKSKPKKKSAKGRDDGDASESEGVEWFGASNDIPGQFENCAICDKRFVVTPYTKAGPLGGLLCPACSKELEKDEEAHKSSKKKATPNRFRQRQTRGKMLDGIMTKGATSLVQLCVQVSERILLTCVVRILARRGPSPRGTCVAGPLGDESAC